MSRTFRSRSHQNRPTIDSFRIRSENSSRYQRSCPASRPRYTMISWQSTEAVKKPKSRRMITRSSLSMISSTSSSWPRATSGRRLPLSKTRYASPSSHLNVPEPDVRQMVSATHTNITPAKLEEFEATFKHFDKDDTNVSRMACHKGAGADVRHSRCGRCIPHWRVWASSMR